MEHIDLLVGRGMRSRLDRIRAIRIERGRSDIDDKEIIEAAIICYWLTVEQKLAEERKGLAE